MALFLATAISFGAEMPVTRIFKVDFKKAHGNDSAVKMCDDSYFSYAELMIPASVRPQQIKAVLAKCPSLKVVRFEQAVLENELYNVVKLNGAWDNCELVFEKPVRGAGDNKSTFTVELGDGC